MSDNNLLINIRANADQMQKEFAKAKTSIGDLAGVFGTIGAAAAGVTAMLAGGAMFKNMVSTTKDVTAEVVKLSKTFGISAEQASVLRVALDDAMISSDDAVAASDRLTRASIKNADAFKTAGVDVRDSNDNLKDSMTVMMEVNDYLKTLKEGKDRDTAAMALYGKGWRELSGILRLTTDGMKEAEGRAKELHLIFGDDRIKAVKDYKLAMKDLDDVAESFKVQIGQELLPVLTQLAVAFGDIGTSAADGTGNILKEKLRDYKDFNAGVSQILRDIGIKMNGGSFGSRWITEEGRKEVKAELEASEQLYKWQMEKNAEKFGSSIKSVKKPKGGNRFGGKDTGIAADKVNYSTIEPGFMNWRAEMEMLKQEAEYIKAFEKEQEELLGGYSTHAPSFMGWREDAAGQKEESEFIRQMEAETAAYEKELQRRQEIDEKAAAAKKELQDRTATASAWAFENNMGQISNMLMQGSKDQFEVGKEIAKAMIAIDTARAASAAFAGAAAAGGPWGVAMGVAAGVSAMAIGTMNMARLDSVQYQPRALGGAVNPHSNYLVGEQGPELIRLGSHGGEVIPNNRLGGSSVSVTPVFQISTGVSDTVQAEIMRLAPVLTQMSVNAVQQAINSGGDMSMAVGRM